MMIRITKYVCIYRLFPDRPLLFKEGSSFTCSNIEEGIYIMTCGNPDCPKFNTVIYIGQSGGGNKAHLKVRMLDHAHAGNPTGVDSHYSGACSGLMRFLYVKEIKDMKKRLSK